VASGVFNIEMRGEGKGSLTLTLDGVEQTVQVRGVRRHFGGFQWYFICPVSGRSASVLWLPPGAKHFASRLAWGRKVAYDSQFQTWHDRAFSQAEKIRRRLGGSGDASADDCMACKPKGMHWRTYEAQLNRWEAYESKCNLRLNWAAARLVEQRN
jgi:hypothetical protein